MPGLKRAFADLSAFYFFYFAWLGAFVPYAGIWLHDKGLNSVEIGLVLGAFIGTKLVAPALWGYLSDHTGHKVCWAQLAAGLFWGLLFSWWWIEQFWGLFLSALAFSFFYHAMLPSVEAVTLARLSDKTLYGRVRLWGSVGFIVTVLLTGVWLHSFGTSGFLSLLLILGGVLFLAILFLKEPQGEMHSEAVPSLRYILLQRPVLALLSAIFLVTASHGVYYNFYSLTLEEAGYSKPVISLLWAWAVLVEVALFFYLHRFFARWSVETLFLAAIVLTAVRWTLNLNWPVVLEVQIFAQALHAASYALFHGAAITLIDRYFTGTMQVRGQGLYAAISHGLGGGVGALLGGYLWHWGGVTLGYSVSIGMAILAGVIFYYWGER